MKPQVLFLALVLFLGYQHRDDIQNLLPSLGGAPSVNVVVDTPSAELQKTVAPITGALQDASQTDKQYLAQFFNEFAEVIVKAEQFTTNKTIRAAMVDSGTLAFDKGELSGKYKQLVPSLEKAVNDTLGLEAGAVDKAKAYNLFKAFAWACGE